MTESKNKYEVAIGRTIINADHTEVLPCPICMCDGDVEGSDYEPYCECYQDSCLSGPAVHSDEAEEELTKHNITFVDLASEDEDEAECEETFGEVCEWLAKEHAIRLWNWIATGTNKAPQPEFLTIPQALAMANNETVIDGEGFEVTYETTQDGIKITNIKEKGEKVPEWAMRCVTIAPTNGGGVRVQSIETKRLERELTKRIETKG